MILYNCSSRVEMDEDAIYRPVGSGTECGMLYFLQGNEVPIHERIKDKVGRILCQIPHDSVRKRQVVAIRTPEDEDKVMVIVKGAPEIVLAKCTHTLDTEGKVIQLQDQEFNYIL